MLSLSKTVTVISEDLSAAPTRGILSPARAPPAKALEIFFSALRREMRGDFIGLRRSLVSIFSQVTASHVVLQEYARLSKAFAGRTLYQGKSALYDAAA